MYHLRDLEEYTADMAEAAAREAAEIRALLENQQRAEIARRRQSELIGRLRHQLFQQAKVLRELRSSAPELTNWEKCVYQLQRFRNWDLLNPAAERLLPTFEDKAFLEQTRTTANELFKEAAERLSPQVVAKIQRRAVLEILVPLAKRYQSWTKVLSVIRRCTPLLFNGMPGVLMFILLSVVFPLAFGVLAQSLMDAAKSSLGITSIVLNLVSLILGLLVCPSFWLGLVGTILRKIIAASLNRTLSPSGEWLTSKITASEVRSVLRGIARHMSSLEPRIPVDGAVIANDVLEEIRNEALSVKA
jgi:hypothetical protein